MKKRLLLISLALVLALTMLMPSAALADNGRRVSGGDFTGSGELYVAGYDDLTIKGPIWRFTGEIVVGAFQNCDWDLLPAGTAFWSSHDSIAYVNSFTGAARGVMKGTFTLTNPSGDTLEGVFDGRISGNLYTWDITDEGSWRSTGGTGAFENVKAWGKWSARLGPGIPAGTFTWQGKYLTR